MVCKKHGLHLLYPGLWQYKDPGIPTRTCLIQQGSTWTYGRYSGIPKTVKFCVRLRTKGMSRVHTTTGDLLDACALAAMIIHAPPGKPYRSATEVHSDKDRAHDITAMYRDEFSAVAKLWQDLNTHIGETNT